MFFTEANDGMLGVHNASAQQFGGEGGGGGGGRGGEPPYLHTPSKV